MLARDKTEGDDWRGYQKPWVGRYLDWASINAVGALGGILVFWDSRVFQLIGKEESRYTINFQWVFTGVYGSTDGGSREMLWEKLGAIKGL